MGIYPPAVVVPTYTLGDKVWQDDNKDGIQDANEQGISNVEVRLLENCNSQTVTATTLTDSEGIYHFSDVKEGTYCLAFSNIPEHGEISPKDQGEDNTKDSDVDATTLRTDSFVVQDGVSDTTWDLGIFQPIVVSDDHVAANTEGPVTTISILDNDSINLNNSEILLVTSDTEGVVDTNGNIVAGATLETSDTLVVEGEGVWRVVDNGQVTFTAQDGFEGTPTPAHYIVQGANGVIQSNVGQITITTSCVCNTYEESSISTLNSYGMVLLLLLTSMLALLLFRKELN